MPAPKKTTDALARAADLTSFDEEARTVDVVFATTTRVLRDTWQYGRFYEELVVSRSACDLTRLNRGAPFLNAHMSSWDARSVMGAIVKGTAKIESGQGVARVQFDSFENDPDAEKVFRKIQKQILTGVSVGYRVLEMKKTKEEVDGIPVYRVTKWEPYEISVAPIPADIESSFRSLQMPDEDEIKPPAPAPAAVRTEAPAIAPAPAVNIEAERAAAAKTERERTTTIVALARKANLDEETTQRFISEGASVESVRTYVLDLMIERDAKSDKPRGGATGTDIGADSLRSGVAEALLHRAAPDTYKLTDNGRRFRGLSLLEIGSEVLEARGVSTRGMSKNERAKTILGIGTRAGEHSTSDFPNILADVAGKVLRSAYDIAPATFKTFSKRVSLQDFRDRKVMKLGDAPQLAQVIEGAEFKRGTLGEGKETYALQTYGRVLAVTRQTLINDDLGAFTNIPVMFGRSAAQLESDLFYAHLISNPTMGDGVALFHANHGNLGTGVINVANVGAARAALRKQKGDNNSRLNIAPKFLLCSATKETDAEQLIMPIVPNQVASVNPFTNRLNVLPEARLDDDTNGLPWYVVADPAMIDTAEYGYLEGEDGPFIESRNGFDVDGLEIKCRHDFACKVIEYRSFYKSSGS